jgi:hypothetical protein
MFYTKPCWAKSSRFKLAHEKIQIARRDRGTKATGDALLKSAQKSLQFNHPRSALMDIENFQRYVPSVSPAHCALLASACSLLTRRWYLSPSPPPIRELLIFFSEIFRWLTNRHPLSCHLRGFFRSYRCLEPSRAST